MAINAFVESQELDVVLPDPLIDVDTVPFAFLKGDPGFSPVVQVADVQGGHNVTINDAEGDHTFFVPDGQDGDDGFSPTVSVVETAGGHIVTITDKSGAHAFTVLNGREGDPGDPGFSPEVNVTPIAGGHEVTITDATGSQSFDVMDGAPGQDATAFVVNYTIGQSSVTCDKTFAQIVAASQSGTPISVTASGLGITGQTGNVYFVGTTIYSVLRYDISNAHQFIILAHNAQDSISLSFREDIIVDTQLDDYSTNPIANAAVAAALADKADGDEIPQPSDSNPNMDGSALPGVSGDYARADHVHPSDTSKLDTDGNAYRAASIPKGELDSTSTATVMTATVPGITELRDGVCMWLKNGVITSASGFTLDINGLGAKPVYGSLADATRATTAFNVKYTMLFVYNADRVTGGCWDMVYGYDTNTTYTPPKLGFGYAVCSTAAATAAKTASISNYELTTGGIVAIRFSEDVPFNATLNISSKGAKAIYYHGLPIAAGIIKAGDTVTMVYSTYYHVLAIDRDEAPVTSVNGQTGAVQIAALPAVTSDDDGKFLCVDNGAWAAVTVPSAAGVSF